VSASSDNAAAETCTDADPFPGRVILHVDMDAFFAAVEQRDNPALKGRPVIIGGGPPPWQKDERKRRSKVSEDTHAWEAASSGRGVVTTCSYEARPFGIHAGMPISQAWRRCPHAVYLYGSRGKYGACSRRVMEILSSFSPELEPVSVDEAFLDVTRTRHLFGGAWAVARGIQYKIRRRLDLTCSVGIGGNHLMAKMASKMRKPAGIFEIPDAEAREILAPLQVGKMHGIGPSTEAMLEKLGIRTLGQLAEYPAKVLMRHFGPAMTASLHRMARGEGGRVTRPFGYKTVEKSMGHSRTFGVNIKETQAIEAELLDLIERVCRRLRRGGWRGKRVSLQLRSPAFVNQHRQAPLPEATCNDRSIFLVVRKLLHDNWKPGEPLRLVGVSVSNLVPDEACSLQRNLLEEEVLLREESLNQALDDLKDYWGKEIISRCNASMRRRYRVEV